jgi:hypothetical protein
MEDGTFVFGIETDDQGLIGSGQTRMRPGPTDLVRSEERVGWTLEE